MKRRGLCLVLLLLVSLLTVLPAFCAPAKEEEKGYKVNASLDTSKDVVLRIAYHRESWPEMDMVIGKFESYYPNCMIVCEYIENYNTNLISRLQQDDQKIDIFRTDNIQSTSSKLPFALNLISPEASQILDLSSCNQGLVDNFKYTSADNTQYAIPYGGEMRGLYVNVTLLKSLGLSVPKNREELLHCCEVLLANDYIPFQGPTAFAQQLLYPYVCNSIVNGGDYQAMYASIERIDEGISEYFRDPIELLYEIVEKGYYNYKQVDLRYGYTYQTGEKELEFLDITKDENGEYKKGEIGNIAFLTETQAFQSKLDKVKDDYHSNIEYKFIVSPVGPDGGYAYLSPGDGLAISNKSDNIDWALEFLNFFFVPEINTSFAAVSGKIPNTADALIAYDIPSSRACNVGQVTFGYAFYKTLTTIMMDGYSDMVGIAKMNNPKYMVTNSDGSMSLMYSVDDYMKRLEEEFMKVKASR